MSKIESCGLKPKGQHLPFVTHLHAAIYCGVFNFKVIGEAALICRYQQCFSWVVISILKCIFKGHYMSIWVHIMNCNTSRYRLNNFLIINVDHLNLQYDLQSLNARSPTMLRQTFLALAYSQQLVLKTENIIAAFSPWKSPWKI